MFCNKCGNQTADDAAFCNKCGNKFAGAQATSPNPAQTGYGQFSNTLPQRSVAWQDYIKNIPQAAPRVLSALSSLNDQAILIPAFIFAVAGVVSGILISLPVEILISYGLPDDINIGAITLWLFTCLGGTGMDIGLKVPILGSVSANFSFISGFAFLSIIPLISLLIARKVYKSYVASKYQGKTVGAVDGIISAAMFAVINTVLSFIPSPLAPSIKESAGEMFCDLLDEFGGELGSILSYEAMDYLKLQMSPLSLNVFWFSLILALLVFLPGIKINNAQRTTGLIRSSLPTAAQGMLRMWLSGAVIVGCLLIYAIYKISDMNSWSMPNSIDAEEVAASLIGVLALAANASIWIAALLSGGKLGIDANIPTQFKRSIPIDISSVSVSLFDYGVGLLVILIGILIAVIAFYARLRDERMFIQKGAIIAGLSAVMIWVLSTFTTIALRANIDFAVSGFSGAYKGMISLTTANFITLVCSAVIFAIAVALIYFIRRIPSLDKVLFAISSRTSYSVAVTILLCVLATVIMVNIGKSALTDLMFLSRLF